MKLQLRTQFRELRRHIPVAYRKQAAHAAADILVQQELFKQSQHIACYYFFNDEFDSLPVMNAIWQAKKTCYLPVLTEERDLYFVRYDQGDALHPNQFGIQEPVNVDQEFPAENLDMVITPLVAFDLKGHRLGTGGGYYDRTFAFLQKKPVKKPMIIGLGFASQQGDGLPSDPWDIVLDGMLTEKEFRVF